MPGWPSELVAHGINDAAGLATTSFGALSQIPEVDNITASEWFYIASVLKRYGASHCNLTAISAPSPFIQEDYSVVEKAVKKTPITNLRLSLRTLKRLLRSGIQDIETLQHLPLITFAAIPHTGATRLAEIVKRLREHSSLDTIDSRIGRPQSQDAAADGPDEDDAATSVLSPGAGAVVTPVEQDELVVQYRKGDEAASANILRLSVAELVRRGIIDCLTDVELETLVSAAKWDFVYGKAPLSHSNQPMSPSPAGLGGAEHIVQSSTPESLGETETPLWTLGLPLRATRRLVLYGRPTIEHVLDSTLLELVHIPHLGPKSLTSVVRAISPLPLARVRSVKRTADLSVFTTEPTVVNPQPASVPPGAPAAPERPWPELSFASPTVGSVIDQWLQRLHENQRAVLIGRLGYGGAKPEPIDSLAQQLKVSRARVAQIEASLCKRLLRRDASGVVLAALSTIRTIVSDHGGLVSETELADALARELEVGPHEPLLVARILVQASEEYKYIRSLKLLGPKSMPLNLIVSIQSELLRLCKAEQRPLRPDELLRIFDYSAFARRTCSAVPASFIAACLRTHPAISLRGGYLTPSGPARRVDHEILVQALRAIGRPATTEEILARASALPGAASAGSPGYARMEMRTHRRLFRTLGPDLFGLAEWDDNRKVTISEAICQLFSENGTDLSSKTIIRTVAGRLGVAPGSIRIRLSTDPRFVRVARGRYALASARLYPF